jgi:hypothetical protein
LAQFLLELAAVHSFAEGEVLEGLPVDGMQQGLHSLSLLCEHVHEGAQGCSLELLGALVEAQEILSLSPKVLSKGNLHEELSITYELEKG